MVSICKHHWELYMRQGNSVTSLNQQVKVMIKNISFWKSDCSYIEMRCWNFKDAVLCAVFWSLICWYKPFLWQLKTEKDLKKQRFREAYMSLYFWIRNSRDAGKLLMSARCIFSYWYKVIEHDMSVNSPVDVCSVNMFDVECCGKHIWAITGKKRF